MAHWTTYRMIQVSDKEIHITPCIFLVYIRSTTLPQFLALVHQFQNMDLFSQPKQFGGLTESLSIGVQRGKDQGCCKAA